MIAYAWRDRLGRSESAEVAELLAACAQADEEAGFSRPVPGEGRHLLVWLLPDDRWGGRAAGPRRLAGYLRIEGAEGAYVVHPDLRSRGITTLLAEQLGDAVPAFTIWSRNDHPAAARLARRFGIGTARREWQLLAPLREPGAPEPGAVDAALRAGGPGDDLPALWGPGAPPARADVLVAESGGAVWFDPDAAEWTEYGPAARIRGVRGQPVRTLLAGALAALRNAGRRCVLLTVASTENDLVHAARTLGFRHDQTDVQYRVS